MICMVGRLLATKDSAGPTALSPATPDVFLASEVDEPDLMEQGGLGSEGGVDGFGTRWSASRLTSKTSLTC
jgi:hypothetical protein